MSDHVHEWLVYVEREGHPPHESHYLLAICEIGECTATLTVGQINQMVNRLPQVEKWLAECQEREGPW